MEVITDTDQSVETQIQYLFFLGGNGTDEKNSPAKGTPTKEEATETSDKASSFSKELARLQFFGAGPKLAGVPTEKQNRDKTRGVKLNFEYDPVSDEIKTYKTII